MQQRDTSSRIGWKVANTVKWGTPRVSDLPMERHVEDAESPTTSGQFVGQCLDNSRARNYQGVTDRSMTSGKIRRPNQYSKNNVTEVLTQ